MPLATRNRKGYRQFWDPSTGSWCSTHRVAAENKLRRELRPHEVVHHLDGDKQNNRYRNLWVTTRSVHAKLHWDSGVCRRCGRASHFATDCYAYTDFNGRRL